jgi:hypothetical protein
MKNPPKYFFPTYVCLFVITWAMYPRWKAWTKMQKFGDFCFFSIHGGLLLYYVSYKVNELAIFFHDGKMHS